MPSLRTCSTRSLSQLVEVSDVGNDKCDVDPFENGFCAFDSGQAQRTDVIDSGSVDEDDRTYRCEFARLLDRVGRGAGDLGDDGDLLVG